MSARAFVLAILLVFGTGIALAQGFAGLGRTTQGFAMPDPEARFVFPDDLGYSVKSEAWQASLYYSGPCYCVARTITLTKGPFEVKGSHPGIGYLKMSGH